MDISNFKFFTFVNKEVINIRIKSKKYKFKDVKIKIDPKIDQKDLEDLSQNKFNKCKYNIKTDDLEETINYFIQIIKDENVIYEEKIFLLNVKYYLTTGPFNKRVNEIPFYSYLEKTEFNLDDIKELLKREKIDNIYDINSIKIQRKEDKYFENVTGKEYNIEDYYDEKGFIILELHYNKTKEVKSLINSYNEKIIKIYNKINKYSENVKKYDLIYLYGSPLVKNDDGDPSKMKISYRSEIKLILDIMRKRKKKFKCLFQCVSQNVLRDVLATKKTKILHISCHGLYNKDNKDYSVLFEDLDKCGQEQHIQKNTLRSILQSNSSKIQNIDLIILTSCHSENFKELIVEICKPKYIIYINKEDEINDLVCVFFTEYFYSELTEGNSISESFYKTIEKLKLNSIIKFRVPEPEKEIDKIKIYPEKSKQYYSSPFAYNVEGELITNENVKINFNSQKYISMIGRSKIITKILKGIKDIDNDKKFSVIYGKGAEKLDFAESLCVHLFERMFIYNYEIFNESEVGDGILEIIGSTIDEMEQHAKYCRKKAIIVIKIEDEKKIVNIKENFANYSNCYFIIVIDKEDIKPIENINCFNALLKEDNALVLFNELYASYGRDPKNLTPAEKQTLLKRSNPKNNLYEPKKISKVVDECILGIKSDEINIEDNTIKKRTISLKPSDAYLFLLSKMPSGLPDCFLQLIFKNNFDDELISKYTMNNWNYFNTDINFEELEIKEEKQEPIKEDNKTNKQITFEDFEKYCMEYMLKALKLYAKLLYYYIEKDRNEIIYPDENIHFLFNSYNNEGIWKSNIPKIKDDENINENEFLDKDFNIQNHRENIYYLISYLVEKLDYIDEAYIYIDYLVEILLLFPSYFFLKKICKTYIKKCKEFCIRCINHYKKRKENIGKFKSLETKLKEMSNIIQVDNINEKEIPYDENIKSEFRILNEKLEGLKNQNKKCTDLFNNFRDNYKLKTQEFQKKFEYQNAKLFLFLYSINTSEDKGINNEIVKDEKIFSEDKNLEIEYNLLKLLKEKDNKGIVKILEDDEKKNSITPKKKGILYYALGMYYYSESKIADSKKCLKNALDCSKGNKFFEHRIKIDSCHIFLNKIKSRKDKEKEKENEDIEDQIENNIKMLNMLMNDFFSEKLNEKESLLRQEFYDLLKPNTIMLNSNPLNSGFSLLSTGIYARPNNQYYILKKLSEIRKDKMKSYIRMKSYILNKQNLLEALKKKAEILIIQSDDFTEKGDIMMESDRGISEKLTIQEFIEILKESENKNKYKIVILSFINSSKLFESIKSIIGYEYFVYFEPIDCMEIKTKNLEEYNKLSIDLIIDLISCYQENITETDNDFTTMFNERLKEINKEKKIFKYKISKNLFMRSSSIRSSIIKTQIRRGNGIFFSDPLLDLPFMEISLTNYENNNYSRELYDIIKQIIEGNPQSFSCNKLQKEKYLKMGIDVIKYFYRHKNFIKFYCIDVQKGDDIELMTKGKEVKNKFGQNKQKKYFYFVYNCKYNNSTEIVNYLLKNKNIYMIIYDDEDIKSTPEDDIIDNESSFESEIGSNDYEMFSVFANKVNYSEDSEDD